MAMSAAEALIQTYRLYTRALEARVMIPYRDDVPDLSRYQNRKERQIFGHLVDYLENLRDGNVSLSHVLGMMEREQAFDMVGPRDLTDDQRETMTVIYKQANEILSHLA